MIVVDEVGSQLRLVFYDGEDIDTGKPKYKSKTFNNVKTTATAEQLFTIATALEPLQERSLAKIERKDSGEIREE